METPETPGEGTLIKVVSESLQGLDLLAELRGKFELDPSFKTIIDKPNDFRNFEVERQLVYLKTQGKRVLCIPKVMIQGRNAREFVISEAHSMLAHLGASKTLDYLKDHVWWRDMVNDVRAYCETCHTCKISKPNNQKPYGLLNPLTVPSYPWESIGMDFVGPLPESGNRDGIFDSITVVICLLTSMVHLIPSCTNYNASQLAELMFEHIYKLHGLPKNIISDRDVLFTSTFWGQLHRLIGTKLRLSSAYHPQSDGSTERANRTITQMLRQCVHPNQWDWVTKLPAIEFAINSARSESTGYAPFFLNTGRMPRSMLWAGTPTTEFPSVREFAIQKKLAIMAAHDSILSARVKQTRDANRKRRDAPFKTGELVYLASKNISFAKGLARKLIPKYIGPYRILQDFGNSSFRLELPAHLKRRGVHDVFHSSLLREHLPNDDRLFPGRMDTQLGSIPETEGEWAVDRILSHAGPKNDPVFEIKWKSGDITWLPYYQISHLQALTDYLDLFGVIKVSKLPKGTGKPPHEDPQIFLGAVLLVPPIPIATNSVTDLLKRRPTSAIQKTTTLVPTHFKQSTASTVNPTVYGTTTMPKKSNRRPKQSTHRGVKHPLFTRISPTTYLMKDVDFSVNTTIHVGQMADYLHFDEQICAQGEDANLKSVPLGFIEFSNAWNDGAAFGDPRRISSVFMAKDPRESYVTPSDIPVLFKDFFITPAQAGVATAPTVPIPDAAQADITQEFAAIMAARNKKQRQYFEERKAASKTKTTEKASPAFTTHTHFRKKTKRSKKPSKFTKPTSPSPSTQSYNTQTTLPSAEDDTNKVPDVPEDQTIEESVLEEDNQDDYLVDDTIDESTSMET